MKKIQEKASPEQVAEVRTGNKSINETYNEIQKEERKIIKAKERQNALPLPEGKYNIILADPPWQYWEGGEKNQSRHYSTMTIEEIKDLPIKDIAADNCILFLWITAPILMEVPSILETWGFSYSTVGFVWIKSKKDKTGFAFGCGNWTRANAEYCLIATKGIIERQDKSISQIIYWQKENHSKKPDIVRDKIIQLVVTFHALNCLPVRSITDGMFGVLKQKRNIPKSPKLFK